MGHVIENIPRQTGTGCEVISAAQVKTTGAGAPTLIVFPLTIAQQFTVDNDYIIIKYRKPVDWVPGSDIRFCLNWTKSQDTDQSGNKVKWQVEYYFTDIGYDIAYATPDGTLSAEDTYDDAGTTTHIAYQADNSLTILNASVQEDKNFLYIKVSSITPSALTLAEPVLLTVSMRYTAYLY